MLQQFQCLPGPYMRRYYGNATANLERLLNLMSNEVVMASKKFLPNEFLSDPEEVHATDIRTYIRRWCVCVLMYRYIRT